MNEIVLIPVELLMHHPDNPRKDFGDLTELADSIKANGVLQNLTVVPADGKVPGKYYVVIGNRRLEASMIAGVMELPCVVSDMDQKTQVATMLEENMQRADLTVYEQAQGFQMMMDLGFNEDQISEKTGFSRTTVKRRLKMAELDQKQLKKVCEDQQVTLGDFEKLAQVEDVKKRNELLKDMGTGSFDWQLNRALKLQKCAVVIPEVKKRLKEQNVKPIKQGERYGGDYDNHYEWKVELEDWNPKKKLIPKVEEDLFYFMDEDTLYFYTKHKRQTSDKPKRSEAEIAEEKARAEAWKQIEADTKTAAELRKAFEADLKMNPKNAPVMLTYFVRAAVLREISYTSPTEEIRRVIGIDTVDWRERTEKAAEALQNLDITEIPKIIATYFEGEATKTEGYAEGVKSREHPKYKKNHILDACYEWLSAYGYHLSDTEKQLMAGTHPCFEKVKANG